MSDNTVHNLLREDAVKDRRLGANFEWPGFSAKGHWTQRAACVPGKAYTLSIITDVAGEVSFGFYLTDGSLVRPNGYEQFAAGKSVVRTLTAPEGAEYVAASWEDGNRRPMVVEGTKPAAWAPAEGETLAGGGALMSANLWDVSAANFKPDADGVYNVGKTTGELDCSIAGASALTENQTIHMGASLRGADKGCLKPFVGYKDAAGNLNWTGFPAWTPTDQWQRFEGLYVVPSGMTLTYFGFNVSAATGDIEVMNPAWSYGSPVCLASSAHTPYATQDHVSTVYATKASLKVTDDSVKAEVSARAQTDRNVADLSSRLTQTANSLTSEISDRRSAITTVTGLANAAQSTADAAKSSASSAVSTANSASTSAANAVKTANSASSTASAASTAAGKASTDAAAAVKTANSASSTASSAATTANSAKSTANAAKSTADSAAKQANLYTIGNGDAGAVPKWIHLGTLTSAGDSSSATISIVFGNGYNGYASQNSKLTITIKDGYQNPQSATGACGVTAMRENCDYALVDVLAQSATVYDVWVYAPWAYSNGRYSISGQYAAWKHSGATQKTEPATSATQVKQNVAYRLADATKAQTMAIENQSSIKQLSNSITSEVTQRTKTDRMVSDLSSRLTQTADGFNASIDRLSDTDKKVNSWFGFGSDASGNPQLTMGSSTSPVVGVYTNAGLAYKARSGATLLELDGASRSSTMPHVHADDVSIGSWQWVPTQGGTHFTLQWIGG